MRVCTTPLAQLPTELPGHILETKVRVCFPWRQDWHQRLVVLFLNLYFDIFIDSNADMGENSERCHVAITELPPRPHQETDVTKALTCAFRSVRPRQSCAPVPSGALNWQARETQAHLLQGSVLVATQQRKPLRKALCSEEAQPHPVTQGRQEGYTVVSPRAAGESPHEVRDHRTKTTQILHPLLQITFCTSESPKVLT